MSATFDMSELRAFSTDLSSASFRVTTKIPGVIAKGAVKIKEQLRKEMSASEHFKGAARDIGFDIFESGFAAEIGPKSGPGNPGALANLAYFGGTGWGGGHSGGTVADPSGALEAEVPHVEKAIADLLDGMP